MSDDGESDPNLERARSLGAAQRRQKATARAYNELFGSPAGEIVLADILREAGILAVGYVRGDPDTAVWHDGRRSLALFILDRLRWRETELVKLARATTAETLSDPDDGEYS